MNCPTCQTKMLVLFTSAECPVCAVDDAMARKTPVHYGYCLALGGDPIVGRWHYWYKSKNQVLRAARKGDKLARVIAQKEIAAKDAAVFEIDPEHIEYLDI